MVFSVADHAGAYRSASWVLKKLDSSFCIGISDQKHARIPLFHSMPWIYICFAENEHSCLEGSRCDT